MNKTVTTLPLFLSFEVLHEKSGRSGDVIGCDFHPLAHAIYQWRLVSEAHRQCDGTVVLCVCRTGAKSSAIELNHGHPIHRKLLDGCCSGLKVIASGHDLVH